MTRFINNQKVEIDVHNMHKDEARRYIERFLSRANGSVREVTVIHGCTSGTVLRDMVRKGLRHPRIKSKVASMNDGITILILS